MRPWKAAGTVVSSGPVTDGRQGEREMPCRADRVASRIERPLDQGKQPAHSASQSRSESSSLRAGSCACAARRCAQRRNEVPRGGSITRPVLPQSPPRPRQDPAPGCARIRRRPQDDGWSSRSRPGSLLHQHRTTPPGPSRPAAGASRLSAACVCSAMQARSASSSSPTTSIRRSAGRAVTAPGGAISRLQSSPSAGNGPGAGAKHRDDQAQPAERPIR